jgi:hypothetical protein
MNKMDRKPYNIKCELPEVWGKKNERKIKSRNEDELEEA